MSSGKLRRERSNSRERHPHRRGDKRNEASSGRHDSPSGVQELKEEEYDEEWEHEWEDIDEIGRPHNRFQKTFVRGQYQRWRGRVQNRGHNRFINRYDYKHRGGGSDHGSDHSRRMRRNSGGDPNEEENLEMPPGVEMTNLKVKIQDGKRFTERDEREEFEMGAHSRNQPRFSRGRGSRGYYHSTSYGNRDKWNHGNRYNHPGSNDLLDCREVLNRRKRRLSDSSESDLREKLMRKDSDVGDLREIIESRDTSSMDLRDIIEPPDLSLMDEFTEDVVGDIDLEDADISLRIHDDIFDGEEENNERVENDFEENARVEEDYQDIRVRKRFDYKDKQNLVEDNFRDKDQEYDSGARHQREGSWNRGGWRRSRSRSRERSIDRPEDWQARRRAESFSRGPVSPEDDHALNPHISPPRMPSEELRRGRSRDLSRNRSRERIRSPHPRAHRDRNFAFDPAERPRNPSWERERNFALRASPPRDRRALPRDQRRNSFEGDKRLHEREFSQKGDRGRGFSPERQRKPPLEDNRVPLMNDKPRPSRHVLRSPPMGSDRGRDSSLSRERHHHRARSNSRERMARERNRTISQERNRRMRSISGERGRIRDRERNRSSGHDRNRSIGHERNWGSDRPGIRNVDQGRDRSIDRDRARSFERERNQSLERERRKNVERERNRNFEQERGRGAARNIGRERDRSTSRGRSPKGKSFSRERDRSPHWGGPRTPSADRHKAPVWDRPRSPHQDHSPLRERARSKGREPEFPPRRGRDHSRGKEIQGRIRDSKDKVSSRPKDQEVREFLQEHGKKRDLDQQLKHHQDMQLIRVREMATLHSLERGLIAGVKADKNRKRELEENVSKDRGRERQRSPDHQSLQEKAARKSQSLKEDYKQRFMKENEKLDKLNRGDFLPKQGRDIPSQDKKTGGGISQDESSKWENIRDFQERRSAHPVGLPFLDESRRHLENVSRDHQLRNQGNRAPRPPPVSYIDDLRASTYNAGEHQKKDGSMPWPNQSPPQQFNHSSEDDRRRPSRWGSPNRRDKPSQQVDSRKSVPHSSQIAANSHHAAPNGKADAGPWPRRDISSTGEAQRNKPWSDLPFNPSASRDTSSLRPHPKTQQPPREVIFIRGLARDISEADIRQDISSCGLWAKDVRVVNDSDSGLSRGLAFITFNSIDEATRWMEIRKGVLNLRPNNHAPMDYSNPISKDWECVRCNSLNFKHRSVCYQCNRPKEDCLDGWEETSPYPTNALLLRGLNPFTTNEDIMRALKPRLGPHTRLDFVKMGQDNKGRPRSVCFVQLTSVVDSMSLHKSLLTEPLTMDNSPVMVAYCQLDKLPPIEVPVSNLRTSAPVIPAVMPPAIPLALQSSISSNIPVVSRTSAPAPSVPPPKPVSSASIRTMLEGNYTEKDIPTLAQYCASAYAKNPQEQAAYVRYYTKHYREKLLKNLAGGK